MSSEFIILSIKWQIVTFISRWLALLKVCALLSTTLAYNVMSGEKLIASKTHLINRLMQ